VRCGLRKDEGGGVEKIGKDVVRVGLETAGTV
jgi:hypothetical protein